MLKSVLTIQDYIKGLEDDGTQGGEIAQLLGVSASMVSIYKHQGYNPSLKLALNIYKNTKKVLHPFYEESLKYELTKRYN